MRAGVGLNAIDDGVRYTVDLVAGIQQAGSGFACTNARDIVHSHFAIWQDFGTVNTKLDVFVLTVFFRHVQSKVASLHFPRKAWEIGRVNPQEEGNHARFLSQITIAIIIHCEVTSDNDAHWYYLLRTRLRAGEVHFAEFVRAGFGKIYGV